MQVAPELKKSADWKARRWLANYSDAKGWTSEDVCAAIRENPFGE